MQAVAHAARGSDTTPGVGIDLGFLPKDLTRQCRNLIESYHGVHGFTSLPNTLWRFHMGPLIERHAELRWLLRRASTTRSAKKANEGFLQIATKILALEILASNFSGWSAIYPVLGETAREVLNRSSHGPHMPLMDFYLYPPKQISAAAVAALAVPKTRPADEAGLCRASGPELLGEKRVLQYASLIRQAQDA